MTIEVISSTTGKITLTELDMLDYDINYERLDRRNPETKRLLIELLEAVKEEKNIDLCSEKLYVEAFPQNDGGCLLYISVLSEKQKTKAELYTEIVCETDDVQSLISLCCTLYKNFSHLIRESELYFDKRHYRLIINTFPKTENKTLSIIGEYACPSGKGEITGAFTREHFDVLIENDAVKKISEFFNP
ncbi:MAG: adaptor protein MecA [Oscillospiraceae bacterium]|nr:adaptor protein MecA [Oscillospiraceae bacterium]